MKRLKPNQRETFEVWFRHGVTFWTLWAECDTRREADEHAEHLRAMGASVIGLEVKRSAFLLRCNRPEGATP